MKKAITERVLLFSRQRYTVFLLYVVLAVLYFTFFGKSFLANLTAPTWFIGPIMAFGSFVAGATFLGGGAVAFPSLTKLLAVAPITAKTFSLAIQSIGMTSASIYILSRTRNLPFAFICLYLASGSLGLWASLSFLENYVPSLYLRIGFTGFLLCFLCIYLLTRHSHNYSLDTHIERTPKDIAMTICCGVLGGLISGLIGSGADLLGFSLLALYFKIEIKKATQISVILMAGVSIIAILMQIFVFDQVGDDVLNLWYVAAPVVLFGAPIGAFFCRRISEKNLIRFICTIVFLECITTVYVVATL